MRTHTVRLMPEETRHNDIAAGAELVMMRSACGQHAPKSFGNCKTAALSPSADKGCGQSTLRRAARLPLAPN